MLGLSIAQAQRAFDLDYLHSMERLLVMARSLLGGRKTVTASAGNQGATTADLETEERKQHEQFQGFLKEMI